MNGRPVSRAWRMTASTASVSRYGLAGTTQTASNPASRAAGSLPIASESIQAPSTGTRRSAAASGNAAAMARWAVTSGS